MNYKGKIMKKFHYIFYKIFIASYMVSNIYGIQIYQSDDINDLGTVIVGKDYTIDGMSIDDSNLTNEQKKAIDVVNHNVTVYDASATNTGSFKTNKNTSKKRGSENAKITMKGIFTYEEFEEPLNVSIHISFK